MKEIVTGSCLLAISVLMAVLFAAYISEHGKASAAGAIVGLALFVAAIAFGFSGCGIFIRGVIR